MTRQKRETSLTCQTPANGSWKIEGSRKSFGSPVLNLMRLIKHCTVPFALIQWTWTPSRNRKLCFLQFSVRGVVAQNFGVLLRQRRVCRDDDIEFRQLSRITNPLRAVIDVYRGSVRLFDAT